MYSELRQHGKILELQEIERITSLYLCTQLSGVTDPNEVLRLTREFCESDCVTRDFPACSNLDPSVAAAVDQIKQGKISFPHVTNCILVSYIDYRRKSEKLRVNFIRVFILAISIICNCVHEVYNIEMI